MKYIKQIEELFDTMFEHSDLCKAKLIDTNNVYYELERGFVLRIDYTSDEIYCADPSGEIRKQNVYQVGVGEDLDVEYLSGLLYTPQIYLYSEQLIGDQEEDISLMSLVRMSAYYLGFSVKLDAELQQAVDGYWR